MSIGERVFFIDGERVTRVPLRRFDSLWNGDRSARMPERAGQRVCCAMAYIEIYDRRPVAVLRVDYMVLPFDSQGHLDAAAHRRQQRLALETVSRNLPSVSEAIVEIGPYRAGRQYRDEFKWSPSEEQTGFIGRLALLR